MLLKDRVMLITNVEKFAGHGTTEVALARARRCLAHDPSFQEPGARHTLRKPLSRRACARPRPSPRRWSSWP